MNLAEEINETVKTFPDHEKYNLTNQIRRSSDSIALNISEGSILQSPKEFQKFMGYSIRSNAETVTCLIKARNRNYIDQKQFDLLYLKAFNLMNMMIAFQKSIK